MDFKITRDNVQVECTFDPLEYGLLEEDILDTSIALIQNVRDGRRTVLNMGLVTYTLMNTSKGLHAYVTITGGSDESSISDDDLYFTDFHYNY